MSGQMRPFIKQLQREIDDSKKRGGMVAGWPTVLVKRVELEQALQLLNRFESDNKKLREAIGTHKEAKKESFILVCDFELWGAAGLQETSE